MLLSPYQYFSSVASATTWGADHLSFLYFLIRWCPPSDSSMLLRSIVSTTERYMNRRLPKIANLASVGGIVLGCFRLISLAAKIRYPAREYFGILQCECTPYPDKTRILRTRRPGIDPTRWSASIQVCKVKDAAYRREKLVIRSQTDFKF